MDANKLKLKEEIEQKIKKEANLPEGYLEDEAEGAKKEQDDISSPTSRTIPAFMLFFQIYDIVSKTSIGEFEDFSNSKVKGSLVKKELKDVITRIIGSKQEKNRNIQTPSKFEGHAWMYLVNDKNLLFLCELKSVLQSFFPDVPDQQLLRPAVWFHKRLGVWRLR